MSDERVIDFKKEKEKVRDKDVDKFEEYIYSMYYKVSDGSLNFADFSREIMEYMEKNNISQDKLMNIQKKFLERYGFSADDLENQLKMAGINTSQAYQDLRKTMSFQEKYKSRLKMKAGSEYSIKNDKNDLMIFLENENIILRSEKNIDLTDTELNEFLCSYKKVVEGKTLSITICENTHHYDY